MRLLVAGVVLIVSAAAAADPHPMASGATPAPITDSQVAMVAETLTIDIGLRHATVNAAVTLENSGAATKLVVGFPCSKGDEAGQIDVSCKAALAITANGKKLRASKSKPSKKGAFWMWTMKLGAGEKVDLVVKYKAPLLNDRYSVPAFGMGIFTYRLTTGARWAGSIGKLNITVNHMHDVLLFVSPAGYKREPGRITWALENHEPTEEVVVIPEPMMGNFLAGDLGAKTAADARKKLDAGDYKKADVEKALKFLRDNKRDYTKEWLPIISPLGGIPVPTKERVDAVIAESIKLLEGLASRAKR
jgi:hypothetical protein